MEWLATVAQPRGGQRHPKDQLGMVLATPMAPGTTP
jgi:hypothetical protein